MSNARRQPQYQTLVQKCKPEVVAAKSVEEQLDALLHTAQRAHAAPGDPAGQYQPSPLEELRHRMTEELLPVFNELRGKYEPSGIFMEMNADDFLNGGVQLALEVRYQNVGLRLEGTVTPGGIAFHETRSANGVAGVVTAGPMLRIRHLSGQTFREFVCERVSHLVRSAMRRY